MTKFIKRPDDVKTFANKARQIDFMPVQFGTRILVKPEEYEKIANCKFEHGLEALRGDLQLKDLNSLLFYISSLVNYQFERGIPEFSAFESYPQGAAVMYKDEIWISLNEIKPSLVRPKLRDNSCDPCDNMPKYCSCPEGMELDKSDPCNPVCGIAKNPSKENGWKLVADEKNIARIIKENIEIKNFITSIVEASSTASLNSIVLNDSTSTKSIDFLDADGNKLASIEVVQLLSLLDIPTSVIDFTIQNDHLVIHMEDGSSQGIALTEIVEGIKNLTNFDTFVTDSELLTAINNLRTELTNLLNTSGTTDSDTTITSFAMNPDNTGLRITSSDNNTVDLPLIDLMSALDNGMATDSELVNAISTAIGNIVFPTTEVIAGDNIDVISSTSGNTTQYTVNVTGTVENAINADTADIAKNGIKNFNVRSNRYLDITLENDSVISIDLRDPSWGYQVSADATGIWMNSPIWGTVGWAGPFVTRIERLSNGKLRIYNYDSTNPNNYYDI